MKEAIGLECAIDLISSTETWCRALLRGLCLIILGLVLTGGGQAASPDFDDAQKQFLSGSYTGCIATLRKASSDQSDVEIGILLSQALAAVGKYPEARSAITNVLAADARSIRSRWQARNVFLLNGQTAEAEQMVSEIVQRINGQPWTYRDAQSLVVAGQTALLLNNDPKKILNRVFDMAQKSDPATREVYLASGNLALEKHDYALAAKQFGAGLKQLPEDPDLHYGLAQAYAPSNRRLMMASLDAALARNSNHVGCLLLLVDYQVDAEDYTESARLLARVQEINPWDSEAWAFRAVLAHLHNQPQDEKTARQTALKFWPDNPRVDYLIGLKLSQKYRFAEGAAYQRQSLEFDSKYVPAKAQLAQDLLRLGEEAEGWTVAQDVHKADAYDVQAFNLVNLRDALLKFTALTNQNFIVRMSSTEAAAYGDRALQLLSLARSNLCAKYGFEVKRPTIVEVFPEQKDFAVRTFGMPGNPGYLGVCFGSVITANSPASHVDQPINWEAVLWHEFCHVVTLQKTRNKMPRWLSEGISVYEEMQANPSWGQQMNPRYREMILENELTPVAKLSAAFLMPKSDLHVQFAYYESALVVEFLVQRYGLEKLKAILVDLGAGLELNIAIEKHTAPLAIIETDFSAFARAKAENLAPTLGWDKPDFAKTENRRSRLPHFRLSPPLREPRPVAGTNNHPATAPLDEWTLWAQSRPTNFWVMTRNADELIREKNWNQAKPILEKLVAAYPDFTGSESAYAMLARVHRELGETNAERQVLAQFAEKDNEALDAYLRLMQISATEQDWPTVILNAQRYLAVNPLTAPPYQLLATASEKHGDDSTAIQAYRSLLALDPPDPAEVHYKLAQLLRRAHDSAARRHVLQALEEAPRFREALKFLVEIADEHPRLGSAEDTK